MKLHYTSAFVIAGLLAAMPARADGAVTRIGQTSGTDCFNAAATVSRTGIALSEAVRKNALTSCAEALTDKITAKDRVATLVNRGTIEASFGDIDSSLADYNAALALNPNMADTYIDRGSALMRAARYEEARADFDKALSLGPTNTYIAYFDRGMALEKSGNLTAAYEDYKQAVALAPDYQPARVELSRFQTVARTSGHG
jgi:tetratricopeptide (TPR) repeat protein